MKVICKLYFPLHDKLHIGPSGVRAPAVSTQVATILGNFLPDISCAGKRTYPAQNPPLFKTTEGVVVGFQIFAWAPKKK